MAYQILGDVHTHTMFSRHAYSTIAENVAEAQRAGLTFLGSADHFSDMLFEEQSVKNFQFFQNVRIWPRQWDDITLLRSCEVDIIGLDGELFGQGITVSQNIVGQDFRAPMSLYDFVTRGLDYVVASIHNEDFAHGASLAQTTEMYIHVLSEPRVFIIGHPGRSDVPFDLDEVITFARDHHKLIEINEHTLENPTRKYHGVCGRIAERCAELGCGIAVSTDAHICPGIGKFPNVQAMLEEIHFPQELIMNRTLDVFLAEMAAAGVNDLQRQLL